MWCEIGNTGRFLSISSDATQYGELASAVLGDQRQQARRSSLAKQMQQASAEQIARFEGNQILQAAPHPFDLRSLMNYNSRPYQHWVGRLPDDVQ